MPQRVKKLTTEDAEDADFKCIQFSVYYYGIIAWVRWIANKKIKLTTKNTKATKVFLDGIYGIFFRQDYRIFLKTTDLH